ncbi:MAG: protein translocase subunit SecF [Chloroflexi bacterium]|nr:protein translocase subunit SecF [Chloroflexota bacterium]
MFNLVQQRRYYFIFSGIVLLIGIGAMIYSTVTFGSPVRLSIDFRGGSLFIVTFEEPATEPEIRDVYTQFGQEGEIIQQLGDPADNRWQIRAGDLSLAEQTALIAALEEQIAPIDRGQSTFDIVDPSVGQEVTTAAIYAVLAAAAIVLGFIWFAFRRVPNASRYGACAILAMVHDVTITMGVMAFLGIFFGWEVDALFLTAVLTVVGFSVQDSIVVFDRIRENIPKYRGEPYETVVNRSILETIHRSLATQLNAVFIMISILLFGGDTVRQFITILLVGLLCGTYSSIFTAVPLLVAWEKGELPWARKPEATRQSPAAA